MKSLDRFIEEAANSVAPKNVHRDNTIVLMTKNVKRFQMDIVLVMVEC